jgi:hypothetical protein
LPPDHPFWASPEEPYPTSLLNTVKVLYKPLHISSNLSGHTFILSSGQQCSYPVKNSAAKYGKFAYSSAFGYSVAVGNLLLHEVGADSVLALSDDGGETWKCRRETCEARFEKAAGGEWLRSMWYPWKDVEVETWLVPPTQEAPLWHLRVHRLRTGRSLHSAEGGFAIYGQQANDRALEPTTSFSEYGINEEGGSVFAHSKAGAVGIVELRPNKRPNRKGQAVRTDANTNLMVPRAVLPTLLEEHQASTNDVWFVTAVFGLPSQGDVEGAPNGWEKEWEKRPAVPAEIATHIV